MRGLPPQLAQQQADGFLSIPNLHFHVGWRSNSLWEKAFDYYILKKPASIDSLAH
jgi:hypothetical protein